MFFLSGGGGGVPLGGSVDMNGNNVPVGYLEENGAAVSRTTYAALFAEIGTLHGAGDGATTFNLPDSRRRVSVGVGGTGTGQLGNAVGNTGGAETITLTTAQMPSHSHGIGAGNSGSGSNVTPAPVANLGTATTNSEGSGQAHNNLPPSIVKRRCIRYA